MKSFRNVNPKSLAEAARAAQDPKAMLAGGGSDLLGMIKERIVTPDTLVNLKAIPGIDTITRRGNALHIGGLATIDSISDHAEIRQRFTVLAEAAGQVATPQIRNVGTIAGNVCQRPWCWYYRNGFKCYKNGGNVCYSAVGENEFHAIFGGGPSYIVHPSDTAVALVAFDATFALASATGQRTVAASEFFSGPAADPAVENVLRPGEVLSEIRLPAAAPRTISTYLKVLDREAWTHAVVSAAVTLRIEQGVCRAARVVLGGVAPIPWQLPEVEAMLVGKPINEAAATEAGKLAVADARPLAKNRYKVPLTATTVKRAILQAATRA